MYNNIQSNLFYMDAEIKIFLILDLLYLNDINSQMIELLIHYSPQ